MSVLSFRGYHGSERALYTFGHFLSASLDLQAKQARREGGVLFKRYCPAVIVIGKIEIRGYILPLLSYSGDAFTFCAERAWEKKVISVGSMKRVDTVFVVCCSS